MRTREQPWFNTTLVDAVFMQPKFFKNILNDILRILGITKEMQSKSVKSDLMCFNDTDVSSFWQTLQFQLKTIQKE